tara:strand:- start:114017 stop:115834 length:1818 start_codon:yes stop_codon:yes gene_type:complete
MKKILLTTFLILSALLGHAQILNGDDMRIEEKIFLSVQPTSINSANSAAPAPPFWSNTFSNPSDWTMVDLIYGGLQNWVISTTGPTGSFSAGLGAISSTSASDGFAMYDSDALNSSYSPQEAYIQYNGTVDCSSYPYVNIEFESYHRKFRDSIFVEVSIDGINWDRYEAHAGQATNTTTANPEFVSVNVSATAGSQPVVYFRFKYEGEWDYVWMIDDVSFAETPNNYVTIDDEVFGGWWIGYNISGGIGCDYTFNPLSQLAANPYKIEAVIRNAGVAPQNMTLHAEAFDQITNSVYTSTSNSQYLSASQQDTFAVNNTFNPTTLGLYELNMWGVGDSANTDTSSKQTVVTQYSYGKDLNNYQGSYVLGNATRENHVTSFFDIYANENLYSVDLYIAPWSIPGTKIYGVLYEADPTAGANPIYLDQTDDHTITSSDLDSWITLSFANPISLIAGVGYEMGAAGYQHPSDSAGVGYSGLALGTENSLFDANGGSPNSAGTPTWYYITQNPMIRMNFDPASSGSTSSKNLIKSDLNIYPNPANNVISISNLDNFNFLQIKDLLGKVVYKKSISKVNNTTIDVQGFSTGTYLLNLVGSVNSVSRKIVIE